VKIDFVVKLSTSYYEEKILSLKKCFSVLLYQNSSISIAQLSESDVKWSKKIFAKPISCFKAIFFKLVKRIDNIRK